MDNIFFLSCFLPLVLIIYWLIPGIKSKNAVLLIFSLIFFAWGSPSYVLLMVLLILFNYFSGLQIQAQKEAENEKWAKNRLQMNPHVNTIAKFRINRIK